jgi:predicted O-methyltransferase YrrM
MYRSEAQLGIDGNEHPVDLNTGLAPDNALVLLELAKQRGCARTLEIGLAYGFSTLVLLAANPNSQGSRYVAVDRFQQSLFHGIGRARVGRLDRTGLFEFYEQPSAIQLPKLLEAGDRFDFIFIDGDHKFDSVMLDLYFAARLLQPTGVLVLDDLWMAPVAAAVSFAERNFPIQRLRIRSRRMAAFQKIGNDRRPWAHFVGFNGRQVGRRLWQRARVRLRTKSKQPRMRSAVASNSG